MLVGIKPFKNKHIFAPQFWGGTPQILDVRLQIWLTFQQVGKFGRVLLSEVPL